MKFLILALCAAAVMADVSHIVRTHNGPDREAQILKQDLDVNPDGSYAWSIETDNGIAAHVHGQLKNPGAENPAQHTAGEYQWTDPNGEVVHLSYEADENGYVAKGSHIPTPPPIPEAIARSLEYIRAHPPPPEANYN